MNSSQVSFFTLGAYVDSRFLKFLLFTLLLLLYLLIMGSNLVLLLLISLHRSLHQPMFLFLLSLFLNQLFGSSALFPFLLVQLPSAVHRVAAPLCFLQIFCIYSYAAVEFGNLTLMSYDRYVAICRPLHYGALMTARRVALLTAAVWLTAFLVVSITTSLSFSLQLCGNFLNKVFCDNYSVVKLSCSDTSANNIYGLLSTAALVSSALGLIVYSYARILQVCFSGSRQTRHKALSTCSPHLASLLNFSFGVCFEVLQSRFDTSGLPSGLKVFLSLYFLTCQPLLNPLLYGLNISKIRRLWRNLWFRPGGCSNH